MPLLSHQTIWIYRHPPLEVSGWSFVMSSLTQCHHWLDEMTRWLHNKKGCCPVRRGIYRGAQVLLSRPLRAFKMAKDISKCSQGKVIQGNLTAWKQGFQPGNGKLRRARWMQKRRWDESFLIGGPELNGLQGALRPLFKRKMEWSFAQTLK